MNYVAVTGPEALSAIHFLENQIDEYNSTELDTHDGRLFSVVLKDEGGQIIGGIGGWTWAHICEITQLWIDKHARKKRIGEKLLAKAETEARARGCHTVLVRSFSFQAPHFYIKYGFSARLVMKEFPRGHDYYFLVKQLDKVAII